MLVIGLTGGIGCGKSATAELFAQLGAPLIDADHITRRLLKPDTPELQALAAQLGADILFENGQLNRAALREQIFADPAKREIVEQILHPRVRAEISTEIKQLSAPYCIIVVPLLIETGMQDLVDRILVVDCDEGQQIKRTTTRDACPEAQVRAIMSRQLPRSTRLEHAHDIIENNSSLVDLKNRVQELHQQYLKESMNES